MYLVYCDCIDSTQLLAKRICNKIKDSIAIVTADIQLNGLGRNSRIWQSSPGGLYFTSILKNIILPQPIPLLISLSVCSYIKKKFAIQCRVKWPNDIFYQDKKIGGILIDGKVSEDQKILFIGIGLNYSNELADSDSDNDCYSPISLKKITGTEIEFSNISEASGITRSIIEDSEYYKNCSEKIILCI